MKRYHVFLILIVCFLGNELFSDSYVDAENAFAEGHYQRAFVLIQETPKNAKVHYLLSLILRKLGRFEEALELLKAIPQSDSTALEMGLIYNDLNLYEEAEAFLSPLSKTPNLKIAISASLGLAKAAIEQSHFTKAGALLNFNETQIPLDALKFERYFLLGELEAKQGNPKKAIYWFEKGLPAQNWNEAPWIQKTLSSIFDILQKADVSLFSEEEKKATLQRVEPYLAQLSLYDLVIFLMIKAQIAKDPTIILSKLPLIEMMSETSNEDRMHAYIRLGDYAFLEKNEAISLSIALKCYESAYNLPHSEKAGLLIKQIQCLHTIGTEDALKKSHALLSQLSAFQIENNPISLLELQQKIKTEEKIDKEEELILFLKTPLAAPYRDAQLYIMGVLEYQLSHFDNSLSHFEEIILNFPSSNYLPESLYWASRILELNKDLIGKAQNNYKIIYENFPDSPFAPESYYNYYSEQEYLFGEKTSLKHLQALPEKFPFSTYALQAYYLLGLDHLRERRTEKEKFISRINFIEAIENFQNVETHFKELQEQHKIPSSELSKWTALKFLAMLERAKTNFLIAKNSTGAKRDIYLNYAQDVFQELLTSYEDSILYNSETISLLEEEAHYQNASLLFEKNLFELCKKNITDRLGKYKKLKISNRYYLAQTYALLSQLNEENVAFEEALSNIDLALNEGTPPIITVEENLNLLIRKAQILKKMHLFDEAMSQLSDVANYPAVSTTRLEAMFLRAELYALQGRRILARKQLESLALKGGDWAIKAKQTLEKEYSYE